MLDRKSWQIIAFLNKVKHLFSSFFINYFGHIINIVMREIFLKISYTFHILVLMFIVVFKWIFDWINLEIMFLSRTYNILLIKIC